MTNAPASDLPISPTIHSSFGPSSGLRRSSYASVAAGLPSQQPSQASAPTVSLSDIMNPHPSTPLSPPLNEHRTVQGGTSWSERSSGRQSYDVQNPLASWRTSTKPVSPSTHPQLPNFMRLRQEMAWEQGLCLPAYLRDSRYGIRLRNQYSRRTRAQAEKPTTYPSKSSGSASSSSISLPKLQPSSRGMTYDVIEPVKPSAEEIPGLPSHWSETDKNDALELHSEGHEVKYASHTRHDHDAPAIRTDRPIPPACGVYYYEVTVASKGREGIVSIGFSGAKAALEKLPGWEPDSWGYHSDDGKTYLCGSPGGKSYGDPYGAMDIIGCGINFRTNEAFFTKNGNFIGNAFKELKDIKLFPSIGMKRPQASLTANFGRREFIFDIRGYVSAEERRVKNEIARESVDTLIPSFKDGLALKALAVEYLSHECYTESAKALEQDLEDEARATGLPDHSQTHLSDEEEYQHSLIRRQIRDFVLNGEIDSALKRTHAYYPTVLRDNVVIYFQLKCRKFIEMLRHTAEILDRPDWDPLSKTAINGPPSNGTAEASSSGHQRMEIDDQNPSADGSTTTSPSDVADAEDEGDSDKDQRYHDSLNKVLQYGQELKSEFRDQERRYFHDMLNDLFSLFAYPDPRSSPTGYLFEGKGAVKVAEELNSAILVSQGRMPRAAIETISEQSDQMLNQMSKDGGSAAFVKTMDVDAMMEGGFAGSPPPFGLWR